MVQPRTPSEPTRPGKMSMAMDLAPRKPTGPKVLRVGLFRDKKIVEERIVRTRETVSIGTAAKNHLIIKSGTMPKKLESRFELFQLVGDDYILNFTGDMKGKVALPGGVQRLDYLRESGAARDAGTHYQIKLADTSRGNIRVGDFTVFFEFVSAPPITPKPQLPAAVQRGLIKNIDWTFTTWVIFSYMLFFGFIIYMENADWKIERGEQEVPETLARLVFEAPIEPPQIEEEVEEGEGEEEKEEAAAEGEEREEKPSDVDTGPPEPAATKEGRARIAQDAAAQAEAMLLGALGQGSGALSDVLQGGAVTANAADVLAQASGVGVATKSNAGTLRTRSGGGSGQQDDLGSLKKSARAGKAASEGKAVQERAVRGNVGLRSGGDIGGSGEFDAAAVQKQIKLRLKSITRCYESELRKNPNLAGKVTVTFTIQERGNVTDARASENTTGSPSVAECVTRTIGRFRFNPGPSGGSVTFRYPFVFQPQN
jgi:TonB family protein